MLEFTEVDKKSFAKFALAARGHNFLQSAEFAAVRADRGADPKFFAVKDGDQIVLAGLCGLYGASIDCLYGPVGEANPAAIKAWTAGIRAAALRFNKIFVSIDPFFLATETEPWQQNGWRQLKRGREERISAIFARPLPANPNEWFDSLDRKMRYEIRRSHKNNLNLRDLNYDELPILVGVLQASADRQNFTSADLNYLQTFYRAFEHSKDYHVRFVVVESEGSAIAGGIFVFSALETVHFLGGNSARSLELGGMYFLLDAMIRASIGQGIPRFNFFGISTDNDSKTIFKRKWGGTVETYFGAWALPVHKLKFLAWKIKQAVL